MSPRRKTLEPDDIFENLLRHPDVWRLAASVCEEHRVSVEGALVLKDRHPKAVCARHAFLAILLWSTDLSSVEVSKIIGVDHSTVLDAAREHERRLARHYSTGMLHVA